MSDRPWKSLAARLKADGVKSEYLDRLEKHLSVEERQDALELEIYQEMASALGRAGAKVDFALLRAEVAARDLEAATDAASRAEALATYAAARHDAIQALQDLKIHREAIGLKRHDQLAALYPIPPKRT